MKKVCVLIFSIFLIMGLAGTALSANTVELSTATSGVSSIYWGPVFCNPATGGASAFVLTGPIWTDGEKLDAGTSLYAISNTRTQTSDTEMLAQKLFYESGATPIGPPQLVSGTSTTVIIYILGSGAGKVGSGTDSGGTLYAIDGGTGTVYWQKSIPVSGYGAATIAQAGIYNYDNSNGTPYCTAPITIDTESYTSTRGGATIYGVSGASVYFAGSSVDTGTGGVSVWARNANTGNYATIVGGAASNVTAFPIQESFSGVSVVHAAPVISGDSLFIIGYRFPSGAATGDGGNTIYQFDKNNLPGGVVALATVNLGVNWNAQWIPTPCVSGGSIFVVDNAGGVTAYRAADLVKQYYVNYSGTEYGSGVTAAPVTNGTYIVLCSSSSVSCYELDNLSRAATSSAAKWGYNFGPSSRYQIWATPVISNGYVWVVVNDVVADNAYAYRFKLNSTDGDVQLVDILNDLVYGSPAFVGGSNLWVATYDPIVKKVSTSGGYGYSYWPQFKFDAAKTGNNTAPSEEAVPPGGDTGCFISTLK